MRPTLRLVGTMVLAGAAASSLSAGAQAGWRSHSGGAHQAFGTHGYATHSYAAHNSGGWGLARVDNYSHRYGGINYYSMHRQRPVVGAAGYLAAGMVYGAPESPSYGAAESPSYGDNVYDAGYAPAQVAPTYSGGYQTQTPEDSYAPQTYTQSYSVPTTVYQPVTRTYTVPVRSYRTVEQTRYVPVTRYQAVTSEVQAPVTRYQTYQRTEQVPTTVYRQVRKVCGCSYSQ
jgi:hypothetical protein